MSDNPDETSYYLRLLSMFMDLGTEAVLEVFVFHSPGRNAEAFLKSKEETLIKMMRAGILNRQECDLLFQKDKTRDIYKLKGIVDIKRFDISLIITLCINLFDENQLTPPKKGWKQPPRNSDKSIAADLLRLRTTRNVIVGHYPKAQLAKWRFDEHWEEVLNILLKIRQQLEPGNEIVWKERINSYRLQTLNPTIKNMYDGKLREWHEEMSEVQDQVEDLLKKLEGFDAYFHNKCDRYERYIKLLVQGGGFVMAAFIKEQTKRQGRDLRKMLDENEDTIKAKISDVNDLAVLYPSQTSSDVQTLNTLSSLNVSALETVILQVFGEAIGEATEWAVRTIGNAYRNYAENALVALDSNTFEDFSSDLKASLRIVSEKLNKDQAKEYYRILEECKKKITENEFRTYVDELRTQGKHIRTFTDIFKETLKKTKEFLQDMVTRGISFKYSHELDLKMITLGTSEEKKQLAENILTEIWLEAVNRSVQNSVQNPEFADVKKKVEHILDEIRKSKSVTNITVTQSCIIVKIACTSPSDMLDMINYFESSEFHKSLNIISKELGYHFNTAFAIKAFIPVDSLWGIQNHQDDVAIMKEEGIRIPISVSSPAGMLQLRSLFNSEKIANSTNSIADALSKHFNEQITLKVETDMREFTKIFDEGSLKEDLAKKRNLIEKKKKYNYNSDYMAVSGRKTARFQGSLSMRSAEDFDKKCDPCQAEGQINEAHGFCVNCQEYLCSNCFTCHKRTKLSTHHQLLEKDDMHKGADMQGTDSAKAMNNCTEKCSIHSDEVIIFFCPYHNKLGCHDCMTLNHRTCNLDYIPDICTGIGDSKEFKEIMTEIDNEIKKTEEVMKKAAVKDKEVEDSHERATKDICSFKKEIDKCIDMIQKQADDRKVLEKQKIQMVVASCSSISTDMKQVKSYIERNKAKDQNGQIFIAMKRAKAKLKSKEVQETEESLEKMNSKFVFQRNKELDAMLSGHEPFGTITDSAAREQKVNMNTFTLKGNINVKTGTDSKVCDITGCEVLLPDKLVITDYSNCKVKIVDITKKCVTDEKALDSNPRDIAVIPDNLIAVTLQNTCTIVILNLNAQLSIVRNIKVKGHCRGILYHQNHMYAVCQNPNCFLTLDMDGNVKSNIPLEDTQVFEKPNFIVAREDFKLFYISYFTSNTIAGITTDGKVSAVYQDKNLIKPVGMIMLEDGSLLVCCGNKTVHHVSGYLKQGSKIKELSHKAQSICYNSNSREFYIGCVQCDHLKIFHVQ